MLENLTLRQNAHPQASFPDKKGFMTLYALKSDLEGETANLWRIAVGGSFMTLYERTFIETDVFYISKNKVFF